MSCRELSDQQLWLYLDREAGPDELRAVEQHLATCPDCPERLARFRRRPLVMGEQRLVAPPPDFQRRVMARVLVEAEAGWPALPGRWRVPLLTARRAAGLAVAALVVVVSSAVVVGAVLAAPLVAPSPGATSPLANSMARAVSGLVAPLQAFFAQWAWLVLALGMGGALVVLAARAVLVQRRQST